jgi:hypothetical protein
MSYGVHCTLNLYSVLRKVTYRIRHVLGTGSLNCTFANTEKTISLFHEGMQGRSSYTLQHLFLRSFERKNGSSPSLILFGRRTLVAGDDLCIYAGISYIIRMAQFCIAVSLIGMVGKMIEKFNR